MSNLLPELTLGRATEGLVYDVRGLAKAHAPAGASLGVASPWPRPDVPDYFEVYALANGVNYAVSDVYPEYLAFELEYLSA